MPARKVDFNDWFNHGIDAASRTIYLGGGIDGDTAEKAIKGLHILDRTDGDIHVKLSSWGGEWAEGMGIFDAIRTCNNQVVATVYGMAGSMGGVILQAADVRRMTPNSVLMVHYGTESLDDHALNITRQAKWNDKLCRDMEALFLKRINEKTSMTLAAFRKRFAFDVFLTPHQAVDLGLADVVWGEEES
jgi:ATP-dependent protease ClpP protease subunit